MEKQYWWARLAPLNPREGHVVQRHVYRHQLYVGGLNPVWYKIERPLMLELLELRQIDGDPRSPRLFQIYDDADRRRVDEHENRLRLAALGVTATQESIPLAPPRAMDLTGPDAATGGTPVTAPGRRAAIPPAPQPLSAPPPTEPVPAVPPAATPPAASSTVPAGLSGTIVVAPPPMQWGPPEGVIATTDLPGKP